LNFFYNILQEFFAGIFSFAGKGYGKFLGNFFATLSGNVCPALFIERCDALRAKRLIGFCATHLPVRMTRIMGVAQRGPDEAAERLPAKQGGGGIAIIILEVQFGFSEICFHFLENLILSLYPLQIIYTNKKIDT
jgi:hypothetical protein